jgi:hypothetical protein
MGWHVAQAVRRPEKRRHAINDILQMVAVLGVCVAEAIPLSTHGRKAAYVVGVAIMVGLFVKGVWDAKPWR